MARRLLGTIVTLGLLAGAGSAQEGGDLPPYQEFVRGLRQRGFYDLAEEFSQQLYKRKDIPNVVRDLLVLDSAEAKLQQAQTTSSDAERQQLLQEARQIYEAFIQDKTKANSPALGEAYRQLATLLANEGHGKYTEVRYTADKAQTLALAKDAIALFDRADQMFREATKLLKPLLEQARPPARQRTLRQFLDTLLQHGRALYTKSLLQERYLEQQAEAGKTRQQAADLFKSMFDYRKEDSLGWVGLAWYGLSQMGLNESERENAFRTVELAKEPLAAEAKRLVAYFRLRDRYRPDLEAKEREALQRDIRTWLNTYASPKSPDFRSSYTARETQHLRLILAMLLRKEVEDMGPKARQSETARKLAHEVLRLLGPDIEGNPEFASVARFVKFNALRLAGDVTARPLEQLSTVEELLLRASLEADEIREKMQLLEDQKLPTDQKLKLEQEIRKHYEVILRASRRALQVGGSGINPRDKENLAQFIFNAYYAQGDFYRAAVILEHLATDPSTSSPFARKAAAAAMMLYRELFQRSRDNPRHAAADLSRFSRMAELVVKNWPKEPEADEARYWLGFFYQSSGRFREAATLWENVSANSPHHALALAEAGELYFRLHATEMRKENKPLSTPSPDLDKALKLLNRSLEVFDKQKPKPNSPEEVRALKAALFLAEAHALLNQPQQAYQRLQPLINAAIKNELPASLPPGSPGRVITLALRSLVQLKRMDEARKLLQELYRAGTQQELGQGVLPILREIAAHIREQIRRLERQGPAAAKELEETRRNFKAFLDDISKDTKLPTEFRLWIIDSYQGIGEYEAAAQRASALREEAMKMLAEGPPMPVQGKPEDPQAKTAVDEAVRLVQHTLYLEVDNLRQHARRLKKEPGRTEDANAVFQLAQKKLEDGVKLAKVEKHPQYVALRLLLLQDQEFYSGPRGAIAGWDNLRTALQPHIERGGVILRVYLDACYNLVYCKYQEARRIPDPKLKERALRSTAELLASFYSNHNLKPRFQEFLADEDTKELLPFWEEIRKQRGF